MNWSALGAWAKARALEPSTWAGGATLAATVAGITLAPEQAATIGAVAATAASVVLVTTKQK